MTKGEAKAKALRWLDEATLNGQEASVETTADYTDKFNYSLWDVLVYLAAIFKIERSATIEAADEPTKKGSYYSIELPDDFMELNKVVAYADGSYFEIPDFKRESTKNYLIPISYIDSGYTVEFKYWGMPDEIAYDAKDTTVLEVSPKAVQLVPLRLAIEATAGSDETNAISSYLENKFSNMVANLIGNDEVYVNGIIERVYAQ